MLWQRKKCLACEWLMLHKRAIYDLLLKYGVP